MNKTALNVIEQALRLQSKEVRHNKTWQWLYDSEGIGTKIPGGFSLSNKDLAYLQMLYDRQVKTSIHATKDTQNRLSTATHFNDEKWATGGVFDECLIFACPTTPVPTKAGERFGGRGCVIGVEYNEIATVKIDKMIVVENATLIRYCDDWYHLLPNEWQSAIFLYRGQRQNARYVLDLMASLADETKVAIYADFDLAGLDIVANFAKYKSVGIVVPKAWQTFDGKHRDNQPLLFARQNTIQRRYHSTILADIYKHISTHKLAITQENVLSLGELAVCEV